MSPITQTNPPRKSQNNMGRVCAEETIAIVDVRSSASASASTAPSSPTVNTVTNDSGFMHRRSIARVDDPLGAEVPRVTSRVRNVVSMREEDRRHAAKLHDRRCETGIPAGRVHHPVPIRVLEQIAG